VLVDGGARGSREDLAPIVHHATARLVGHHAAAERVHADQAVGEVPAGDGIRYEHAVEGPGGRLQVVLDLGEDGLVRDAGPDHLELVVVVEAHRAGPTVV